MSGQNPIAELNLDAFASAFEQAESVEIQWCHTVSSDNLEITRQDRWGTNSIAGDHPRLADEQRGLFPIQRKASLEQCFDSYGLEIDDNYHNVVAKYGGSHSVMDFRKRFPILAAVSLANQPWNGFVGDLHNASSLLADSQDSDRLELGLWTDWGDWEHATAGTRPHAPDDPSVPFTVDANLRRRYTREGLGEAIDGELTATSFLSALNAYRAMARQDSVLCILHCGGVASAYLLGDSLNDDQSRYVMYLQCIEPWRTLHCQTTHDACWSEQLRAWLNQIQLNNLASQASSQVLRAVSRDIRLGRSLRAPGRGASFSPSHENHHILQLDLGGMFPFLFHSVFLRDVQRHYHEDPNAAAPFLLFAHDPNESEQPESILYAEFQYPNDETKRPCMRGSKFPQCSEDDPCEVVPLRSNNKSECDRECSVGANASSPDELCDAWEEKSSPKYYQHNKRQWKKIVSQLGG